MPASDEIWTCRHSWRGSARGLPERVTVAVEPAHGLVPEPRTGKFRRVITHVAPT